MTDDWWKRRALLVEGMLIEAHQALVYAQRLIEPDLWARYVEPSVPDWEPLMPKREDT